MSAKRLMTISEITGTAIPIDLCESCGESGCNDYCEEYGEKLCVGCPVQNAFNHLAAYEDTDMSPQEIKEMREENQRLTKENESKENYTIELFNCIKDAGSKNAMLQIQIDYLKLECDIADKTLELVAEYIVDFGCVDDNLCGTMHTQYSNDFCGENTSGGKCYKCVAEHFTQKAKEELQK